MEAAEQRGVIYDTKVNVQSAINLIFVLPRKVSTRAKTSTLCDAVVFHNNKNGESRSRSWDATRAYALKMLLAY